MAKNYSQKEEENAPSMLTKLVSTEKFKSCLNMNGVCNFWALRSKMEVMEEFASVAWSI